MAITIVLLGEGVGVMAKRCDVEIPKLPASTTEITGWETCDEGEMICGKWVFRTLIFRQGRANRLIDNCQP